ncbi:MAG: type II secretion system F family protein [Lachnospiraceae bacterium]|nr:type II secretion system F family protein [Lachnospiraceae bacterium]
MGRKRDLAIFCHKMEQALHSGFDIERALMVVQDEEKGLLADAVRRTYEGVRRGKSLSLSMRKDELVFTSELVSLIYVTEQTGRIEYAFHRMAEKFDRQSEIESKLVTASIYPAIVMIVFVISLFAVASVWGFLPHAILAVAAIICIIVILIATKYSADTVSRNSKIVGNVFIKLPVIGRMILERELADFADNMATFYACGVPIDKGLEYCVSALSYEVLRDKVLKAASWVRRGNPLSQALLMQAVFPPDLIHSLKIGEESGNVDGMLIKIAEYYRLDTKNRTDMLMNLMR